jgi:hypothetical protein
MRICNTPLDPGGKARGISQSSHDQPLYTFTSDGEQIADGGVTHVYMPQAADVSYFGYGTSA